MSHFKPLSKPPLFLDMKTEAGRTSWEKWFATLVQNVHKIRTYEPSINPASVAANSESTQTFTVPGLITSDVVMVNKPTKTTDLSILDCYVSALNTLSITFRNFSGSPIDAGAEVYRVVAIQL